MKRLAIALLVVLFALPAHAAGKLVFAALPTETPESLVKEVRPLLDFLTSKLGIQFTIEYSASYEEILGKFRKGKVDLALLGPLPYVALKEKYPPASPLVVFPDATGRKGYTCKLITASDPIKRPADLPGKRVALTQPLSTCGYLGTETIFRKAGLSLAQTNFLYLEHHDQVALAVVRGEFAAGGIMESAAEKYRHLGLRILASSELMPLRPLIANSASLQPKQILAIREALIGYKPLTRPADRAVTKKWGERFQYGAVVAHDADYDSIRALRRSIEVPARGSIQ